MHVSDELDCGPVTSLIKAAARRRTWVIAIEQLAFTAALVCGGITILLLLGTQVLAWYWLWMLALAGSAFAAARTYRRMLPPYRVAQLVDRKKDLHDSLSTAWFLAQDRRHHSTFAERQIESANEAARQVDTSEVFPYSGGRVWAFAAAMAAVAFGLFALRYLATSSLDLRASIVPLRFVLPTEVVEQIKRTLSGEKPKSSHVLPAEHNGQRSNEAGEKGAQQRAQSPSKETAGAARASAGSEGQKALNSAKTDRAGQGEKESSSGERNSVSGNQNQAEPSTQRNASNREQADSRSEKAENGQQSGVVGKVKEALSSLMAKMRPQAGDRASSKSQTGQQSESMQQQNSSTRASQSEADQRANNRQQSGQDAGSEAQAQGSATEKTGPSQSRANASSNANKGSDSHSGIGTQDGEKAIKDAEQLKAMGKLQEIIGKRSADLTGEMSAETFSGEQHLKSQYSGRVGQHSDLGGDIDRNEVPTALRNYVRDYMEQVRRQPDSR